MSQLSLKKESVQQHPLTRMWQGAVSVHRPLAWMTAAMAVIAGLGLIGVFADGRIVLGQPVWAKTTKFAISIGIYGATLLWLFSYIKEHGRFLRLFLNGTAGLLALEIVIIITQAVRGQAMHFNYSTALDGALYTIMAISIYILFTLTIIAAVLVWRQDLPGRVLGLSLKLGLALTVLAGFGVANLMTTPTANQMVKMQSGAPDAGQVIGAHTVGAEDGGPGLPLLGWSTEHGDLRIAHFFGLHALQIVPLVGWLLSRQRESWLSDGYKVVLVWVTAVAYLCWVVLVTWQALRGQPFIAPDGLTLLTLASLVSAASLAAGGILFHARHTKQNSQIA